MSEHENTGNESHNHASEISPGRTLADARHAVGMSIEQAAKELFMTLGKLQALENDDFNQFNSPIFVRGYLRSYAKLLKINGDEIVAMFDAWLAAKQPQQVVSAVRNLPENPQKHLWKFILLIAFSLFALYLISIWFFDKGKGPEEHPNTVANSSLASTIDNLPVANLQVSSAATVSANSSESISNASVLAMTVQSASSQASVKSVAQSSVSVTQASLSAVQTSASVLHASASAAQTSMSRSVQATSSASSKKIGLDEINFNFREESWIEVSDSRGDVLATELQPAGSHLSLTGRAPFDIKLGNAPGVDVQLNGKKIPVVPLLTSKVLIMKVTN